MAARCRPGLGGRDRGVPAVHRGQLATNPSLITAPGTRSLTFFVLAVGFIGGFTSEVVYRKLRDRDVVDTSALPPVRP